MFSGLVFSTPAFTLPWQQTQEFLNPQGAPPPQNAVELTLMVGWVFVLSVLRSPGMEPAKRPSHW